jgi:hypothetical protein
MRYGNDLTLGEARQQYFERSGFGDGGYTSRWVRLKAGPVSFYFPNTRARMRAVKLHDLHHILTEYDTTWSGEAEIGAWEVASGCGRHYAAWFLNLNAFALGLGIAPSAIYRAFLRGRRTRNLYTGQFEDSLLSKLVGSTRRELQLDRPLGPPVRGDRIAFVAWAVAAVACLVGPYAVAVGAALLACRRLRR